MQLSKVKLIGSGTGGINVVYSKPVKRGDMTFRDEYTRTCKVPIGRDLRDLFIELEDDAAKMLGLKEGMEVQVTGIVSNEVRIKLMCQVTSYDGQVYSVLTGAVDENTEYRGYDQLLERVKAIYDLTVSHVSSKGKVDMGQIIIDFKSNGNEKEKEKIRVAEQEEDFTEDQKLSLAMALLEKRGCLVFSPEEVDVDSGNVDDTF